MLESNEIFFPVGQGLFYAGKVLFKATSGQEWTSSFVFDCGSSASGSSSLLRSIGDFHTRRNSHNVDFIVLSHLHEDHANGALAGPAARLRLRHSEHWRLLQDLPVQSIPMILRLHLGRWCCRHAGCER